MKQLIEGITIEPLSIKMEAGTKPSKIKSCGDSSIDDLHNFFIINLKIV